MYTWVSELVISMHNVMMDDSEASIDLSRLFMSILKFYRTVFEAIRDDTEEAEDEMVSLSVKGISEFLMLTSNDVCSTKCKSVVG